MTRLAGNERAPPVYACWERSRAVIYMFCYSGVVGPYVRSIGRLRLASFEPTGFVTTDSRAPRPLCVRRRRRVSVLVRVCVIIITCR